MTFTTRKSHLKYPAFEDQRKINLFLDEGKVKVEVNARGTPGLVVLDNFETRYNDGQWHKVMFVVMENRMELTVDEVPMQTVRIISVISGKHFLIAGAF
ncbi:Neurexin-4 [Portunus trituberculatus]|uniref:Neurexin-4 n=1 Tax=Portunus trituberculatus TaxID=210409 RepID=A0A5B7INW2_PORTR|nr:Neurexin-4 [Portunus trituberculatus]